MTQARAIWLIIKVKEANIRLNEVGKTHDNAITTLHKGVLRTKGSENIKRSMRLLHKDMVILYKGLPHPKGKKCRHGHQMQ